MDECEPLILGIFVEMGMGGMEAYEVDFEAGAYTRPLVSSS